MRNKESISHQSFIAFCLRAGLSLQTHNSSLYPLLSPPFRIFFIQSIYYNVVYYLIRSSASIWLPVYLSSRASVSRQFLLSQWPSQFLFLFISSSIILPAPTLSSTTEFFIFSANFTRSILLHIHISKASSRFCSFRHSFQVSAPFNATLHTKHFTSLFRSSFSKGPQKILLFLLKASFAIAILCFISWGQFMLLLILHPKYFNFSTCSTDSS